MAPSQQLHDMERNREDTGHTGRARTWTTANPRAAANSTTGGAAKGQRAAPWKLWSGAQQGKTENTVAKATIVAICEESRIQWVNKQLQERHNNNFEQKAWFQADITSGVWV
jgi:hypothetical protein